MNDGHGFDDDGNGGNYGYLPSPDGGSGGGGGGGKTAAQALMKRDRSLKLEAQFLRTLACRAGVLGSAFVREERYRAIHTNSKPFGKRRTSDAMEVADDEHEGEAGVRGSTGMVRGTAGGVIRAAEMGIGGAVPGHLMQRLETLALKLVDKYMLLSLKDRALARRGLCQLWMALSGPGQKDGFSRVVRLKKIIIFYQCRLPRFLLPWPTHQTQRPAITYIYYQ